MDVRNEIFARIDPDYKTFLMTLIPNKTNILGVRLPHLRQIAKTIAKGDWRTYLNDASDDYFEEVMLQGIVIGYVKTDIRERLKLIEAFVPKIDNWSVCDSFCASLKSTKQHRDVVWKFLQQYFSSNKEFELRFAIVMLIHYYIEETYIQRVIDILDRIQHDGYYVKMAVAWALSICFVKFPEWTMNYLKNNSLDDFTYNKALQKIIESDRIDNETKETIRQMKRKNN